MFKPLLRTIPTLSGNFTLACKLDKYSKNSIINYECGITEAVLMPLQNNLANKHVNVSLLYDSFEYDVQIYYKSFSSLFYESNYKFDENNVYDLNLSENKIYESRNKDYEFGCKRNIMNSGYQYMFYAPFYVTDTKSLPDEFVIHLEFANEKNNNKIHKNIHIKIFDDPSRGSISNYLDVYLKRYIEKIDERCIFCLPESNQAAYFGIDVQTGGFKNCKDNVFGILYNKQLSLNEFDRVINEGFVRNKLIMRQIVPLSFMFNVSDILTKNEYNIYLNKKIKISGWYERNGMKYDFYDFDTNYKHLSLNNVENILSPKLEEIKKNKNLQYSLYEADDNALRYDNTVSIMHNRWCLLPTLNSDEKYITNSSNVFLDSNNNYYNVPIMYQSNSSYLYYDSNTNDIDMNKSFNSLSQNNIENLLTQTHFTKEHILDESNWYDVYNNKCIIGGLLYDLNNLSYTQVSDSKGNILSKYQHIDKFNVFAYINVIDVDNENIKYCKYSLNTDNPFKLNSIAYNGYFPGMFTENIVQYSYLYNRYHEGNTIFESKPLTYSDLTYYSYHNIPIDDIYIDYSSYYYLSNLYKNIIIRDDLSTYAISQGRNIYGGFEIYKNIDAPSFVDAVSYYSYYHENDNDKKVKLTDICYITINNTDSIKRISEKSEDDEINNRNAKIAFFNPFIDCQTLIDITYYNEHHDSNNTNPRTHYEIAMDDYAPYINSYYHYIPSYDDSAFVSRGHMEKNNIHTDYVYADMWILKEYIDYINKFVSDEEKLYIDYSLAQNSYMGFINYDHYDKYKNRMYGDNCPVKVLEIKPYIKRTGNNVTSVKLIKTYRDLNENDNIKELIKNNKLYHFNKAIKITKDLRNKILNIYKKNYSFSEYNKYVSLILYTTNTDIIPNFKISKENIITIETKPESMSDYINYLIDLIPLLIPLTTEILWSKKSVDETYRLLSSKNIKTDVDNTYITHDIYDLTSCNRVNTTNENYIKPISIAYLGDGQTSTFYKRKNVNTIDTDGTLHIVENNGLNYAYYYITLNLYNNVYSINLNTINNIDTFDLNKLTLKQILPYIKTNILNYIVNELSNESIIKKNDVTLLIDKEFNETAATVTKTTTESKLNISRYYNDITPLLINTSSVTSHNLIYIAPNNVKYKNIRYKNVIYTVDNLPIEAESYDDNMAIIPYIDYDYDINKNNIKFASEYERKFYNNNEFYMLSEKFEITDNKLYSRKQIQEFEDNDYVLNKIFIPHMKQFISNNKMSDDEYLFLFNRYRIEYTSYPVKLNALGTDKLYKLKFTFILL